jgi:hypothetical protein
VTDNAVVRMFEPMLAEITLGVLEHHLPLPLYVEFAAESGITHIELRTPADTDAWTRHLGLPIKTYDGRVSHSAGCGRLGHYVTLSCWVED